MSSRFLALLAVPLLLSPGCSVEPLVAAGRPCSGGQDCPEGTYCHPTAAVCLRGSGVTDARPDASDADGLRLDAPRDLHVSMLDSAIIDQVPFPDLSPKLDHNAGLDLVPCQDLTLKYAGSHYVNVSSNSVDMTNNFTVAAWVKPSGLKATSEYHIVSRHNPKLATGFVLMIRYQVPEFRVYQGLTMKSCQCNNYATKLTQTNVWYHLAGSFSAGTTRLFLDGKLIKSCSCPKNTVASNVGELRVGASSSYSPVQFGFIGQIDDVVVAKTARTVYFDPRQTTSLLPCSKVVARWTFAEGKGQSTASLCGGPGGTLGSSSLSTDFNDPIWIKGTCLGDR